MVKPEVQDLSFGVRVFYVLICMFMISVYFLYNNDLSTAIKNQNYPYFGLFFVNLIISYYLFLTCGNNPGYLELNREFSNIDLELQKNELDPEENTNIKRYNDSGNKSPTRKYNEDNQDDENNISIENNENNSFEVANNNTNLLPDKHYCSICKIYQPIRAKHCDLCEKCVYKYDHHCTWLGTCIGEFNHRRFWIYLVSQTSLHIWSFSIAYSGLMIYDDILSTYNIENKSQISGKQEYYTYMIFCLINFILALFCGSLLIYHTYLILTNQTTWEFTKRNQITYLRIYPKEFLPFHKGIFRNFMLTFCHDGQKIEWILPPMESIKIKKIEN